MSTTYTITINGSAATEMSGLGLALTNLTLANMQPDAAGIAWSRRSAAEACPMAHNDTVEIFSSGRRIFRGRARIGAITAEGAPIKIMGPWSHLDEMTSNMSILSASLNSYLGLRVGDTFTQAFNNPQEIPKSTGGTYVVPEAHTAPTPDLVVTWTVGHSYIYTGAAAPTVGTQPVNGMWTTRHWLFRPGGTVGQVYTLLADQYAQILAGVLHVSASAPFTVGTTALGGVLCPKLRTVSDATMADCLRQSLAMKPDAAIWWTYDGAGVPVLNARVASLETPVQLTVGQRNGQAMPNYQLAVARDLVPTCVIVRWESDASQTTGLGNPIGVDQYPAGVASYEPGVLIYTVERETPYVAGIAQEVYASLATPRAQGSLTVLDPDFSTGLRPGMVITLAGDVELEGVQLWVQQVAWDANTGLAQLTVGHPAHLQLKDRLDLKGWFRFAFNGPHFSTVQIVPPPP